MQLHTHRFKAMGGPCELQLAHGHPETAINALAAGEREIRRIEQRYSRYRSDSIVAQLNANAGGRWTECDEETLHLLDTADMLYRQTDGLFDATSGVLRKAWRFDGSMDAPPTDEALAPLLSLVDWSRVERRGHQVRLGQAGMEIDFGGFGKEYAVDRVAALWHEAGLRHGLVNLAGDIRVLGGKPDGSAWQLGIQHPRQPGALLAQVPLTAGALTTSGDYERFLVDKAGVRHCHILHPKTGRPAYAWQSVTVVAPLALMAGAMSTTAMLMGSQTLTWLRSQPVDFLAVDALGAVFSSNSAGGS